MVLVYLRTRIFPFRLCHCLQSQWVICSTSLANLLKKNPSDMKISPFNIACYILVFLYSTLPSVLSLQKAADPFCEPIKRRGSPQNIPPLWFRWFSNFMLSGRSSSFITWLEVWHEYHAATITFHYLSFITLDLFSLWSDRLMASLQGGSRLLQAAVRLHSRRIPAAVSPD